MSRAGTAHWVRSATVVAFGWQCRRRPGEPGSGEREASVRPLVSTNNALEDSSKIAVHHRCPVPAHALGGHSHLVPQHQIGRRVEKKRNRTRKRGTARENTESGAGRPRVRASAVAKPAPRSAASTITTPAGAHQQVIEDLKRRRSRSGRPRTRGARPGGLAGARRNRVAPRPPSSVGGGQDEANRPNHDVGRGVAPGHEELGRVGQHVEERLDDREGPRRTEVEPANGTAPSCEGPLQP